MNHAGQPLPPPAPDSAPADEGVRRIGVLIVDRHVVVREGLRRILDQHADLAVLGDAASSEEALALVGRRRPDIIILGLDILGDGGLEATRQLLAEHSEVRIVAFSQDGDPGALQHAGACGARGFVRKDASGSTIAHAIREVATGRTYTDPSADPALLALTGDAQSDGVLTIRERQILQLLADGCTNRDVCALLPVSPETVKTHVAHILTKLHAAHRSQAVAIAIRTGLIR